MQLFKTDYWNKKELVVKVVGSMRAYWRSKILDWRLDKDTCRYNTYSPNHRHQYPIAWDYLRPPHLQQAYNKDVQRLLDEDLAGRNGRAYKILLE